MTSLLSPSGIFNFTLLERVYSSPEMTFLVTLVVGWRLMTLVTLLVAGFVSTILVTWVILGADSITLVSNVYSFVFVSIKRDILWLKA